MGGLSGIVTGLYIKGNEYYAKIESQENNNGSGEKRIFDIQCSEKEFNIYKSALIENKEIRFEGNLKIQEKNYELKK